MCSLISGHFGQVVNIRVTPTGGGVLWLGRYCSLTAGFITVTPMSLTVYKLGSALGVMFVFTVVHFGFSIPFMHCIQCYFSYNFSVIVKL